MDDGGAALVRYEVDGRVAYPGKVVGEVQGISTKAALDWEHFAIGDEHFLVVANYKSGSNYNLDSVVYKYNAERSSDPFQSFQTI